MEYKHDIHVLFERIVQIEPRLKVEIITTSFGSAIKLQGKHAKIKAWHWNFERYLDGYVDTNWSRDLPRHGLGYLIPFYNNPIEALL